MIRRLALILPLAFLSVPALAQQPPDEAFVNEWQTVVASDTLTAASHKHTAELAQKLVGEFQRQRDELKKVKDDLAASESQKQTLVEWLQKAQKDASP